MPKYSYSLVDVFTDRPFGGNPLAVFADARGISEELMPLIARELNLSETTFVFPPDDPKNDYKVRIFTPSAELPVAGHPTVGTAYVLARMRNYGKGDGPVTLTLEEGVGPVPVTLHLRDGRPDTIWMHQPLPDFTSRPEDPAMYADLLSLAPEAVTEADLPVEVGTCGVPFLYVPVEDLQAIRRAKIRLDVADRLPRDAHAGHVYVFTLEVEHAGNTAHGRMFAPSLGITEDPATGAASGPLGAYLVRHGVVAESPMARITLEQGFEMARPSAIQVEVDHEAGVVSAVRVGGRCVAMGEGSLDLP